MSQRSLPQIDPNISQHGVRTHCPYCAYQCGTLLDVQPNDIRLSGDPSFPVNNGRLCVKGLTAGELIRHPYRILNPLMRSRGGELQETTWDAALDRIAAEFWKVRRAYGSAALGAFGSGALTNEKAYMLGKFARLALRTPHVDYNGRYCMSSAAGASNRAFGMDRGMPFPVSTIGEAHTILLVGSNPFDTLPPITQWFEQSRDRDGRLIVSDVRRTLTARSANLFIQPTVGSDLALANGMLFVAIEEKLVDIEFLRERTNGWEAVRSIALRYDPVTVERMTGVPEQSIRRVVRMLAEPGISLILTGRGPEQHSKGVDTVHSWINLSLALGLFRRGGYGTLTGQGNGQGGREHGQKADQLPGYRLIENPSAREHIAKIWGVAADELPGRGRSAYELLNSLGQPDGIRALMVLGSNVAVASPNLNNVIRRLKSLDFLCVIDAFHNETTELADVILPTTQWAEEDGTLTNLEGRVIRRRQASQAPPNVRSDLWIFAELAKRLEASGRFDYPTTEAIFDELRRATAGGIADYAGMTYQRIEQDNGVFWPCPSEDHPGTPYPFAERFAHADGKAKLFPVEHRLSGDEPDSDYPIYFTTGRYQEHYNSGAQTRKVRRLMDQQSLPRLQIHPDLAREYRVTHGSSVEVESRRATATFQAEITDSIRPDTLFAPFHWGGAQAANLLVGDALDPTSRMPEFKIAAVRFKPTHQPLEEAACKS